MDMIPMSQEGYNKIKAEVEELEDKRPAIAEAIAKARDEGDLKENAEYHGQREALGLLDAKIRQRKDKLARAFIVDESKVPRDQVAFGATVIVKDLDYDDEEVYTLVGEGDENYDDGKIKLTSPIGQGLLGKKVGDKVEIEIPVGTLKLEVLSIEYRD